MKPTKKDQKKFDLDLNFNTENLINYTDENFFTFVKNFKQE